MWDVDSDAQTVLIATNYQAAYHVQDFGTGWWWTCWRGTGLRFPGKIVVDNELISPSALPSTETTFIRTGTTRCAWCWTWGMDYK